MIELALKKRAKKAKKAGKQSERKYVLQLKKKNNLVLNAKGIPDIFAHNREGWKFYEIKPHQMRTFKGRWYPASEKSRLLNCNISNPVHTNSALERLLDGAISYP